MFICQLYPKLYSKNQVDAQLNSCVPQREAITQSRPKKLQKSPQKAFFSLFFGRKNVKTIFNAHNRVSGSILLLLDMSLAITQK